MRPSLDLSCHSICFFRSSSVRVRLCYGAVLFLLLLPFLFLSVNVILVRCSLIFVGSDNCWPSTEKDRYHQNRFLGQLNHSKLCVTHSYFKQLGMLDKFFFARIEWGRGLHVMHELVTIHLFLFRVFSSSHITNLLTMWNCLATNLFIWLLYFWCTPLHMET